MRFDYNDPSIPVYTHNSLGGPQADPAAAGEGGWETDGELTRAAATLHAEDDDFGQAGTLYREVFDDAARERFFRVLVGQRDSLTRPEVIERFYWYWTQVDAGLGDALRAAPASVGADAEPTA